MSLMAELRSRFALGRQLGRGSYGEVVEATDRVSGVRFALKHLEIPGDGERERREIAASLRLDHPHVVRCYEGRLQGKEGYLLMELAEGTLAERIRHRSRRAENFQALCQVARGLVALHAEGLIHRDLKPANVLFVDGRAKLADLGLTRDLSLATVTAEGMILGTPGYLAPEQAQGRKATPAVDHYALGILFYEAMVGELPYAARSAMELLQQIARAKQHRLPSSDEVLAPATRRHIEQLLHPEPGQRPADLAAWLRTLETLPGPSEGGDVGASTRETVQLDRRDLGSSRRSLARSGRRGRSLHPRWRSGAAALVLSAGVAGFLLTDSPSPEAAHPAADATREGPFTPEDLQNLRDRLTDLQAKVILEDGTLADPERASGQRSVPFPDADPLQWGNLSRWIPEVARFRAWAAAGGDPRELSEEVQREMQRTDEYLVAMRMPRLFGPVLAALPAPRTEYFTQLLGTAHEAGAPPSPAHTYALVHLYPKLTNQVRDVGRAMHRDPEEPFPEGAELSFLERWRRFQKPESPRAQAYFETYGAHRPARLATQPFLRPRGFDFRRTTQTLRLAYGANPSPSVALLGGYIAEQGEMPLFSEALTDPLVIPPGDDLAGLPRVFVAELLLQRSSAWSDVGRDDYEVRDRHRGLNLFRQIMAEPRPENPPEQDLRAFAIRRSIWWLRNVDFLESLDLLRAQVPSYEGNPFALTEQLWRITSDIATGPRNPEDTRGVVELAEELLPGLDATVTAPVSLDRVVSIRQHVAVLRIRLGSAAP